MKAKSIIRLLCLFILLTAGPTFGQKRAFNSAMEKNVRAFDGCYFVDLSKKNYSSSEIEKFAANNGYTIYNWYSGYVSFVGEPKFVVLYVTMLPIGATPDVAAGHANPANEPYKSIKKAFDKAIKKGVKKNGTFVAEFKSKNEFVFELHDEVSAFAAGNNYYFTRWYNKMKGTPQGGGGYVTYVHFLNQELVQKWVLTQSFKDVSTVANLKTGKVRLDPESNEWIDGILWTGNVIDGKISGTGHGAKMIKGNLALVIDGTFKNGLPVGKFRYRYGNHNADGVVSLYGPYNVFDDSHATAGYSVVLTPQADPNVNLIKSFRTTEDVHGTKGEHKIRYGYVDDNYNLLCWLPEEFEFVQPMQNGKAIIKIKRMVDNAGWGTYGWGEYNVSAKGDYSISDNDQAKLLSKYDELMSNWNDLLKPYNGEKGGGSLNKAWKQRDEWILTQKVYDGIVPDGVMGMIRTKRTNIDRFELLLPLIRLDEVTHANSNNLHLSYSFIYNNPNWASKRRSEGEMIMSKLRVNPKFNPPYWDSVFNYYSKELERFERNYAVDLSNARQWHAEQEARFKREYAERKQREKEEKQRMCDNCKVDGSKSTVPTGFTEKWSFLIIFGQPAQSENAGTLVLKNGIKTEWKYIYEDGKTHTQASGDFVNGYFDDYNDMVNYIIEKCEKKYCR